jgi:hypothetical protein
MLRGDRPYPGGCGVFLGDVVGGLGQRLGRSDADADWNAGPLLHRAADVGCQGSKPLLGDAGQIQERLVDRIDLHLGGERLEGLHDAAAHVAVERVIAGEDGDLVPLDQGA